MSSLTQPGVNRVPTDAGTAIPSGGSLTFVGAGGVTISASESTVTVTGPGGGGGITDIDGDTGTATGSTITFDANTNAGESVLFDASGATVLLKVTDANSNTYIGGSAGKVSGFATNNTSVGKNTLKNVGSAAFCTMVGDAAGASITDAQNCTGVGQGSLNACTSGGANSCFGGASGASIVDGIRNTCAGFQSGVQIVSGNNSTLLGYQAGFNYATNESYNICIGSSVSGTVGESNVMRLGATTGADTIASTFIAGVAGVSVANTNMVTINTATGQMGSASVPGGIGTINGDSGSATGATVTFNANTNAGKTVTFSGSGTTISLNVSDGSTNTCVGFGAGNALAGGSSSNTTFGYRSGTYITTGQNNLGLGYGAFCDLSLPGGMDTGSNNIAIGKQAGNAYTNENSNILIGNSLAGVGGDTGVIRIGTGSQTTCFIQGINGVTVTGTAVLCATDGQLGTVASSIRYKDNVVDMADTNVMKLRPVNFTYKKSDVLQYGLIAEEVEEVFKDLVFYNDEGKPESVHYEKLPAILLHELQKQNKRIEALEALLAAK